MEPRHPAPPSRQAYLCQGHCSCDITASTWAAPQPRPEAQRVGGGSLQQPGTNQGDRDREVGSRCHASSPTVWRELSLPPASPTARPSHFRVCIVSHILIIHEKASQSIPSMIPL